MGHTLGHCNGFGGKFTIIDPGSIIIHNCFYHDVVGSNGKELDIA